MKLQTSFLCIIVIIALVSTTTQSIRFEIESSHTKCIAEDIKSNSMTVGHYSIVNPNEGNPLPESHRITLRVTSSYGNSYHSSENVQSGQFAFQAVEAGDYMACFFAIDHQPPLKFQVEFDWRSGVASKDWSNVAKKGSVDAMEYELKKLADTITSIHDEMLYLRDRAAKALVEMRNCRALLEKDQFRIEQRRGCAFKGWSEGAIFPSNLQIFK